VGRGDDTIRPEVELRADEAMQGRVVAYLRDVFPGYALPPSSGESVQADGIGAPAPEGDESWTLTVKCEYLSAKQLVGVAPDASVRAFLALAKKELDFPNALPLSRLALRSPFHDADAATTLRGLGLTDGGEVLIRVERPPELPLVARPLVVHLSSRRSCEEIKALASPNPTSEQLMKPPRHPFIVRGDVSSGRVLRHLDSVGELEVPFSPNIGFWWGFTYKGDGKYVGYALKQNQPMDIAGTGLRRCLLLEDDYLPKDYVKREKQARGEGGRRGGRQPRPTRARPAPLTRLDVSQSLRTYRSSPIHLPPICHHSQSPTHAHIFLNRS